MNNLIIFIIICIIVTILVTYLTSTSKLEHLTTDEAIQNIANMYNIDKLTVKDAQIDVLSGPTITAILNRLNAVEGQANYLDRR